MKKAFFKKNKIIIILLIISIIYRIYYSLTHFGFGQDVARDLLILEKYNESRTVFIPYGPKASVGNFYLPPFYYQFYYFLLKITGFYPHVMKYFTTIVEALTPIVIYKIFKKYLSKNTAFVSSLLYIFSNMINLFGTIAWNPSMIPFLSSLALLFYLNYLEKNKGQLLTWALILTTIAIQLHYQSVVLIPFSLIIFIRVILKDKKNLKYYIFGILLSLLLLIPYFVSEYKSNWDNTKAIINYFSQEHSQYFDRVSKPDYVINFYPEFIEKIIFGKEQLFNIFGRIIFYIGMTVIIIRSIKEKHIIGEKWIWIFVYFFSIIITLRLYKGDKLEYYLSTLFILPFFLIATIQSEIEKRYKKANIINLATTFLIVFIIGTNIRNRYNEFFDLKNTFISINQSIADNTARFQFHNDDYVNSFAYGLKHFTKINPDLNSLNIIDICEAKDKCKFDKSKYIPYSSTGNIFYSYSSELKYFANEYKSLAEINYGDEYKVSVSKISNLPKTKYNLDTKYDYGNDFLISRKLVIY